MFGVFIIVVSLVFLFVCLFCDLDKLNLGYFGIIYTEMSSELLLPLS